MNSAKRAARRDRQRMHEAALLEPQLLSDNIHHQKISTSTDTFAQDFMDVERSNHHHLATTVDSFNSVHVNYDDEQHCCDNK